MNKPVTPIFSEHVIHSFKIVGLSERIIRNAGSTITSQLEMSVMTIGNTVSPAPRSADEAHGAVIGAHAAVVDDRQEYVSEPRFPCFKFNAAMGFRQASAMMTSNAWCGFYLAVREPGSLQAGESFELLPGPREVGIAELFRSRRAGGAG